MKRLTISLGAGFLCLFPGACVSRVSGHVYHNNGGVVQVEFKSGGRAYVSAGSTVRTCNFSESDKSVRLVCDGDATNFNVQNDGALAGPANGLMARLTPVKD